MRFGLLHDARFMAALLAVGCHASLNLNKVKYFGASADGWASLPWFVCEACAALPLPELCSALPIAPNVFINSSLLWPQDAVVVGDAGAPLIVVKWSVLYELMFHALMALAIANSRAGCLMGSGTLICVPYHLRSGNGRFPLRFISCHHMLMFGVGMSSVVWAGRSTSLRNAGLWLALCVAGVFATGVLSTWFKSAYGAAAIVGLVGLDRTQGVLLPILGEASYVLYLVHYPLVSALSKVLSQWMAQTPMHAALALTCIVAFCVGGSVAFHQRIERPMVSWLNRQLLSKDGQLARGVP